MAKVKFAPIPVLVCVGESAVTCLEIMESAKSDFPGHAVVLVNASEAVNPGMQELSDPLTHFGMDVDLTWRASSTWSKGANPDAVDWVLAQWGQDWMVPLEPEVNVDEEIADLDRFDEELSSLRNTSG